MSRADFKVVPFHQNFNNNNPEVTVSFDIEGVPLQGDLQDNDNDAYLMIQTRGVSAGDHDIAVNGQPLDGTFDIPAFSGNENEWAMWMRHLNPGLLQSGQNDITITRSANGGDNFRVGNIVVNWREE